MHLGLRGSSSFLSSAPEPVAACVFNLDPLSACHVSGCTCVITPAASDNHSHRRGSVSFEEKSKGSNITLTFAKTSIDFVL